MNATAAGPAAGEDATPVVDARRWLALVDTGDYAASWASAGALFQLHVTQEAWTNAVGATRKPLGPVVSRELSKEERKTSLPGLPDGEYDIIQFATEFANKKAASRPSPSPVNLPAGGWTGIS